MKLMGGLLFRKMSEWASMVAVLLVIGAGFVPVLAAGLSPVSSMNTGDLEKCLLFTIGVHVEPLGLVAGKGPGYNDQRLFELHVQDLRLLAGMVERHGGTLVVQAQTPFTRVAASSGERVLSDLQTRGHEIALHFHEDAHLGRNPESQAASTWAKTMTEEISFLRLAGATKIRYWSGGNLYPGILDAASAAGLDVMSDYKNPHSQETSLLVLGVNPWRPSDGPSGDDLTAFSEHSPNGRIIYLPDGSYDPEGFAAKQTIIRKGGMEAYFHFLEESLARSLRDAQPDRVNVFHVTIHPGEFTGDPEKPYAILDSFLSRNVDPLAASGSIRWATFSQMADAYTQWEETHCNVNPHSTDASGGSSSAVSDKVEWDSPRGSVPSNVRPSEGFSGQCFCTVRALEIGCVLGCCDCGACSLALPGTD